MEPIKNLKSVQVFQLAFAHRNVTKAAQALNTSQSAVSYHIKKLEEELGVTLFRRSARGLEPTEAGTALAADVDQGLSAIRMGLERAGQRTSMLKVAVLPMFASRWLSSRLGGFWERHPGLQLSIQNHNNRYVRLENPSAFADLGIQWGRGAWPKFEVHRLWPERMVVVCSPAYRAAMGIERAEDLARATLLHVDDTRMWEEWLGNAGLALSLDQPQMMLEDRHFQLSSTINGLGVSLFAAWLVEEELNDGRLVDPFERAWSTSFSYHLAYPRGVALSRPAVEFRDWILALSG
ncbi:MAG: LysR substrate-binding domain-containing protein [Pseudomonadota bacterium]